MYEVVVSRDSYERIQLLARAWEMDASAAIDRLLAEFQRGTPPKTPAVTGRVSIFANYRGTRTEAMFDPVTEHVLITTGVLAGRDFPSPSGAAVGLVKRMNPEIRPERNGWNFWMLTESGRPLYSIRRPR